jgi:hypothetical protein
MTPVMRIMHKLHELYRKPSSPLSMVHPRVDSLGTSTVASTPLLLQPIHHDDKVNEVRVLFAATRHGARGVFE